MHQRSFTVSTDKSRLDLQMIHGFLSHCYWAEGMPFDTLRRSVNALCFAVFDGNEQVGFARVITDRATYGYIGDVFIIPSHRGKRISKQLMTAIMDHPELQGFRRWSLVTNDAHGLYKQFGFQPLANPQRYMEIINRNVYLATEDKPSL